MGKFSAPVKIVLGVTVGCVAIPIACKVVNCIAARRRVAEAGDEDNIRLLGAGQDGVSSSDSCVIEMDRVGARNDGDVDNKQTPTETAKSIVTDIEQEPKKLDVAADDDEKPTAEVQDADVGASAQASETGSTLFIGESPIETETVDDININNDSLPRRDDKVAAAREASEQITVVGECDIAAPGADVAPGAVDVKEETKAQFGFESAAPSVTVTASAPAPAVLKDEGQAQSGLQEVTTPRPAGDDEEVGTHIPSIGKEEKGLGGVRAQAVEAEPEVDANVDVKGDGLKAEDSSDATGVGGHGAAASTAMAVDRLCDDDDGAAVADSYLETTAGADDAKEETASTNDDVGDLMTSTVNGFQAAESDTLLLREGDINDALERNERDVELEPEEQETEATEAKVRMTDTATTTKSIEDHTDTTGEAVTEPAQVTNEPSEVATEKVDGNRAESTSAGHERPDVAVIVTQGISEDDDADADERTDQTATVCDDDNQMNDGDALDNVGDEDYVDYDDTEQAQDTDMSTVESSRSQPDGQEQDEEETVTTAIGTGIDKDSNKYEESNFETEEIINVYPGSHDVISAGRVMGGGFGESSGTEEVDLVSTETETEAEVETDDIHSQSESQSESQNQNHRHIVVEESRVVGEDEGDTDAQVDDISLDEGEAATTTTENETAADDEEVEELNIGVEVKTDVNAAAHEGENASAAEMEMEDDTNGQIQKEGDDDDNDDDVVDSERPRAVEKDDDAMAMDVGADTNTTSDLDIDFAKDVKAGATPQSEDKTEESRVPSEKDNNYQSRGAANVEVGDEGVGVPLTSKSAVAAAVDSIMQARGELEASSDEDVSEPDATRAMVTGELAELEGKASGSASRIGNGDGSGGQLDDVGASADNKESMSRNEEEVDDDDDDDDWAVEEEVDNQDVERGGKTMIMPVSEASEKDTAVTTTSTAAANGKEGTSMDMTVSLQVEYELEPNTAVGTRMGSGTVEEGVAGDELSTLTINGNGQSDGMNNDKHEGVGATVTTGSTTDAHHSGSDAEEVTADLNNGEDGKALIATEKDAVMAETTEVNGKSILDGGEMAHDEEGGGEGVTNKSITEQAVGGHESPVH